jgi:6-phosphogluconolactonase
VQTNLAYVGSYTAPDRPVGITVFRRDPDNGQLERLYEIEAVSPSWVTFSPDKRTFFCVNEILEYEGEASGAVSSYAIDQDTGDLRFLSKQSSKGGAPCHICTDRSGRLLFVANHEHGNVATLPIRDDGSLEPASDLRQHEGSGPGPTQEGPHAHFVTLDPSGERLLAVDKGIDKVMIYRIDSDNRRLVSADPPHASLHSGAAPRHLAFHPNGKYAYVNGEADMTITAFGYDAGSGTFDELHYLSTLPEGASAEGVTTAGIEIHPSGRWVYVSNRGHDSIAIFEIDQATGRLTATGHQPSGGRTPRGFGIDPEGNVLYAGNQDSHTIVPFRIDQRTGELTPTGDVYEVGAPVTFTVN